MLWVSSVLQQSGKMAISYVIRGYPQRGKILTITDLHKIFFVDAHYGMEARKNVIKNQGHFQSSGAPFN